MIAARGESKRRAGFTLIEILAGVAIFLICVVSIMSLFGVAMDAHKGQVDRSTAAIVAQRAFSHFRAFPPSDVLPFTWLPYPEPWLLELAVPIREDATTINLAALPDLDGSLALAPDSGVFWQPAYGRPARALIEDPEDPDWNEWITFEAFENSPASLLSVSRGQLRTMARRHGVGTTVRLSFYFPDYPRYSFLLRTRRYSMRPGLGLGEFDLLDVTVFWNEMGRAQQETFSFALSDRTQFDLTRTGVFFPPP